MVRNRISHARLRSELAKRLPFETEVVICKGNDVLDLLHPRIRLQVSPRDRRSFGL